jgi:hypothetical protein
MILQLSAAGWFLFTFIIDDARSHEREVCEMHIFSAQYYHRAWGLLLSVFPINSARFLIAAAHTSDQKVANKQAGRCYHSERPFCTLIRYTLRRRTAPFIYMCLTAQACGRETRVHAGRWHAGHNHRLPKGRYHSETFSCFLRRLLNLPRLGLWRNISGASPGAYRSSRKKHAICFLSWLGYGVDTRTFVHGIYDRTVTGDRLCMFEL